MAAKYDFKTSPDIQGEKEQPTLYPQIVVSGTKSLKDLAKDIARRSTVHEGTVVGLLCDLESIIANYLADGYNVKLGELGTFSATLTCRKVTDKSEIRAASVHFDNIKFKPTRKFRKEVRSKGKLERAEYGFRTSSTRYSAEERFVRLTNYLKEHSIITCKEYCALTGLLKTKAGSELRQWSNEKKIERDGRAPHVIYRRCRKAEKASFHLLPPPGTFILSGYAGSYEIRPQQNQRHTEPLPYIKSHIRLFGNLRILHKLQSKTSAKKYKQAYSGY